MIIKKTDISSIFPIIIKIIKLNFEVVSKLAKSIFSIPNIAEVVVLVIVKMDNLNDFSVTLTTPIKLTFEFSPSKTSTGEIITAVQKEMLTIVDLQTLDSDLEDVFIRMTNLNG